MRFVLPLISNDAVALLCPMVQRFNAPDETVTLPVVLVRRPAILRVPPCTVTDPEFVTAIEVPEPVPTVIEPPEITRAPPLALKLIEAVLVMLPPVVTVRVPPVPIVIAPTFPTADEMVG